MARVLVVLLITSCGPHGERAVTELLVGEGADGHALAADGAESFPCFAFRSAFGAGERATAIRPIVDNARALHHFLLFRTAEALPEGPLGPCTVPADAELVVAWSPGGEAFELPDGVGLSLPGPDERLLLQMHYLNVGGVDRSGVAIETRADVANVAGTFLVGTALIDVPPRARGFEVTHRCTQRQRVPLHVVAAAPHMHDDGRAITTEVTRAGGETVVLFEDPSFDYERQQTHLIEPEFVLEPGDVLRTTCTYDNPSDEPLRYGVGLDDEMCLEYLTLWPIDAFDDGDVRFCW